MCVFFFSYVGEDAAEHFLTTIMELETKYAKLLKDSYKPLEVTPDIERRFAKARVCYLCHKAVANDGVMDHDHLTGEKLML